MANQAYCHAVLGQKLLADQAIQVALAAASHDEVIEEQRMVAYACLARVHWVDGHYGTALALVWRALCLAPPWQSLNGQLLLAKAWETLLLLPQQWQQAKFGLPQPPSDDL